MSIAFNKVKTALGMDDMLPFGRHQGYTVLEILKDRPEYIEWLISDTSLRFYPSVHEEIQRRAAEIANAYKPRRRMFEYKASDDEWEYDVPW